MSATNGHAAVDLATLEAELDELEKRADAMKLLAEKILGVAGAIGFGMIVVIFAPWVHVSLAPKIAVAKTIHGTMGLGWLLLLIVAVSLLVSVIGFRSRKWLVVAAGSMSAIGMGAFLIDVMTSVKTFHPYMKLGAGAAHGAPVASIWGFDLAVAVCLGVGAAPAAVAAVTRMWDVAEQTLDRGESTLAADKPGLLRIENLVTYFPIRAGLLKRTVGHVHAVDGVDLTVYKGETVGLVGESGCGKTTLSRTILKLVEPTSGRIYFNGRGISRWGRGACGPSAARCRSSSRTRTRR